MRRLILCEGFDDRAFLRGLLGRLGCIDCRYEPITNKPVRDGKFGLTTPGGHFVIVQPVHSKSNFVRILKAELELAKTDPLEAVVVARDPDTAAGAPLVGAQTQMLHGLTSAVGALAQGVRIDVALLGAGDPAASDLPPQETLNRLVLAAIRTAHAQRTASVGSWLQSRPNPPSQDPGKEQAWAHMAGWYAEKGCQAFFETIWEDPALSVELESRLTLTGAYAAFQREAA